MRLYENSQKVKIDLYHNMYTALLRHKCMYNTVTENMYTLYSTDTENMFSTTNENMFSTTNEKMFSTTNG